MSAGVKDRTEARRPQWGTPLAGLRRVLRNPATSYTLIFWSVLALTTLGLLMVLSASSITAFRGGEGSPYSFFLRQAVFAAAGLVLVFGLARIPIRWWRVLAWVMFAGALGLQLLTLTPLGIEVNGNRNWVGVESMRIQPSELLKAAFAVWLGAILSRSGAAERPWGTWGLAMGGFAVAGGLVMAGGDLGTAIIFFALFLGAMFVADLPVIASIGTLVAGSGAAALFVVSSANRMSRVGAMLAGRAEAGSEEYLSTHWQSAHGTYALASGGWFGVGLGASREKWAWLPEAHNDFIFAIIGEELGLLGSLVVIALFTLLGWGMLRIARSTASVQTRVVMAAAFMWLIGQATVNIAVVANILPVIGVPLPFVSYGGSAMIASMMMVGIVLSFARAEPGTAAALRRSSTPEEKTAP